MYILTFYIVNKRCICW